MTTPRYQRLADLLRNRIEAGHYRPGTTIPSIQELAETNGMAKETVRAAIGVLAEQGYVRPVRKGGTIVLDRTVVPVEFEYAADLFRPTGGIHGGPWETACHRAGVNGTMQPIEVVADIAAGTVAEALRLEAGADAIRRTRHALIDSKPAVIHHAWYDHAFAAGTPLGQPKKIIGGIYGALVAIGRRPARLDVAFTARNPTDAEAAVLRLDRQPVIVANRTTYDAAGEPIEYLEMIGDPRRVQPAIRNQPIER